MARHRMWHSSLSNNVFEWAWFETLWRGVAAGTGRAGVTDDEVVDHVAAVSASSPHAADISTFGRPTTRTCPRPQREGSRDSRPLIATAEVARRLLLDGHRPAEVATAVGLHDQAHLNRHFIRHVGTPPALPAHSHRFAPNYLSGPSRLGGSAFCAPWWRSLSGWCRRRRRGRRAGGRRRHGGRRVLAAIVFVVTSGCTWQQLPSASFGPSGATAHRRFSVWSKASCGPSSTAWSPTNQASVAIWTGCGARSTRWSCEP
ncbi:transposase [Streptomyces sp. NPDC086838]|uniref:transposase n=1 Tax=Streptomyces sp. NPDC086838 TaxID=3365762 RepID=UPI0037FCEC8B